MAVFNSLGSNYSKGFVLFSLIGLKGHGLKPINEMLSKHYDGQVALLYKGRQALELAVRLCHLTPGSRVGINGFTCYVVYEAIVKAGHHPVFIDVATDDLNFGVKEMKAAGQLKAVIVQNTLGFPCDMEEIKAYCDKQGIIIIEDLAHSQGAYYQDGTEAGMAGRFVMLSFSQDKPLDVVAGGALINRSGKTLELPTLPPIFIGQRLINYFYPLFSWLIRLTYPIGIGRYLHAGLKRLQLLATPMSDGLKKSYRISTKAASLLIERWLTREKEAAHRRAIAAIYKKALPHDIQFENAERGLPLYLRFPISVKNRAGLIAALKKAGIHIGDTWYDAPIAPSRYLGRTSYKTGQCPNAEKLADTIVNLPTHINVSKKAAKRIAEEVNKWLSK